MLLIHLTMHTIVYAFNKVDNRTADLSLHGFRESTRLGTVAQVYVNYISYLTDNS